MPKDFNNIVKVTNPIKFPFKLFLFPKYTFYHTNYSQFIKRFNKEIMSIKNNRRRLNAQNHKIINNEGENVTLFH